MRGLLHYEFSAIGVSSEAGGVLVAEAPSESAAFALGLRRGDFIRRVNGRAIPNPRGFLEAISSLPADAKPKFSLTRNQQPLELEPK